MENVLPELKWTLDLAGLLHNPVSQAGQTTSYRAVTRLYQGVALLGRYKGSTGPQDRDVPPLCPAASQPASRGSLWRHNRNTFSKPHSTLLLQFGEEMVHSLEAFGGKKKKSVATQRSSSIS
ncbi:hypothetical protein NQD34_004313 [Periophthalmus magnuspinnatus]|nr:hypothetical protein NQD34_004313 [Periophthalmus magnuspinnatus]